MTHHHAGKGVDGAHLSRHTDHSLAGQAQLLQGGISQWPQLLNVLIEELYHVRLADDVRDAAAGKSNIQSQVEVGGVNGRQAGRQAGRQVGGWVIRLPPPLPYSKRTEQFCSGQPAATSSAKTMT